MENHSTVIYVARSLPQAHLLKIRLAEDGIQSVVTNTTLQGSSGIDMEGWTTMPRVVVHAKNALVAREIALYYDRQGVEMAQNHFANDQTADLPDVPPEQWPRCPQCGQPRVTRCKICGTAGTQFALADEEYVWGLGLDETPEKDSSRACGGSCGGACGNHAAEQPEELADETDQLDDQPDRLVLVCPTCSEPFLPEFAKRCAGCGHEFDDGYVSVDDDAPDEPANGRAMAIAIVLLGVLIAGVFYFLSL